MKKIGCLNKRQRKIAAKLGSGYTFWALSVDCIAVTDWAPAPILVALPAGVSQPEGLEVTGTCTKHGVPGLENFELIPESALLYQEGHFLDEARREIVGWWAQGCAKVERTGGKLGMPSFNPEQLREGWMKANDCYLPLYWKWQSFARFFLYPEHGRPKNDPSSPGYWSWDPSDDY